MHIFSHCQNVQVHVIFQLCCLLVFGSLLLCHMCYDALLPILTAVNIKGVFNTSNETKYEKEAPDGILVLLILIFFVYLFCSISLSLSLSLSHVWFGEISFSFCLNTFILTITFPSQGISIDFNFYKTFWSLQVSWSCFLDLYVGWIWYLYLQYVVY